MKDTGDRRANYEEYLRSDHWRILRQLKFKERGKKCFACPNETSIHVHHIRYKNLTDVTIKDLIVLCEECHDLVHMALKSFRWGLHCITEDNVRQVLAEFRTRNGVKEWVEKFRTTHASIEPIDNGGNVPMHLRARKPRKRRPNNIPPNRRRTRNLRRTVNKLFNKCQQNHNSPDAIRALIESLRAVLEEHETPLDNIVELIGNVSADENTDAVPIADRIELLRSPNGGWSKESLEELGVPWPPPSGWKEDLLADRS